MTATAIPDTATTAAPAPSALAAHHDARVAAAGGSVLQEWAWGAFKARYGWDVARAAGDDYAVQLLIKRRGPVAIGYVPRGPAVDWTNADAVGDCLRALDGLCRESGVAFALIEGETPYPPGFDLAAHRLRPAGYYLQPPRTIVVPCDKPDDALLTAMKQKTRYNIKLAARRGVTVRVGAAVDMPAFYEMLQATGARDGFHLHTQAYYADLLRIFGPQDSALLLVEYDGVLVAGAILLRGGNTTIYHTGASADTHREHMPAYALQYAALRWARDAGCSRYDLWGIPRTDEPPAAVQGEQQNVRDGLWGVYRFKQGFGGIVVSYPGAVERGYNPLLTPVLRRLVERRRNVISG